MSWLRIDDGFAANPKIASLTDRELRVWLRVLCYCAKLQDPTVDRVTIREVSGLNSRTLSTLISLGLLDKSNHDYVIHDWAKYQPKDLTGADRQAKWRSNRNAQSNGESNAPDRDENVTLARVPAARGAVPVPVPVDQNLPPSSNVDLHDAQPLLGVGWTEEEISLGRRLTESELADRDRDEQGVPLHERRQAANPAGAPMPTLKEILP